MRDVGQFEAARLALVPEVWRAKVERGYRRKLAKADAVPMGRGNRTLAEQCANAWLRDVSEVFAKVRMTPGLTEADIRDKARECAKQAMGLVEIVPGVLVAGIESLRARLNGFVDSFGIKPPSEKVKDAPAVARMTCPIWWRRALRIAQARQLELGAITLGYVHKRAEIYASDATVARRAEQRRRNAAMMAETTAQNLDTGDEYTLAQLAALSVSNPAIRRGELMTRINGFESVAKGLGHIAEFVTLTCPSRFHRMRKTASGFIEGNPKHDGSSPREAQQYLGKVWARIRAKLARMGLKVYGFRIAEPHHDACPHWHLILFMQKQIRDGVRTLPRFRAVFRRYALQADGEESGAKKYRVKFESIDWSRGTAAGYVLKYISKNIDGNGYAVQGDLEGDKAAIFPASRVEAWASTWGIRQFQQIGGAPVGVWRELRRMAETEGAPEVIESARSAADVGNWARYTELMGGPLVARAALPLRAAYRPEGWRIDPASGEVLTDKTTAYGEPSPGAVCGVRYWETVEWMHGIVPMRETVERVLTSRRYQWEIKRAPVSVTVRVAPLGLGFGGGEASATRTRVNNCTRPILAATKNGGKNGFIEASGGTGESDRGRTKGVDAGLCRAGPSRGVVRSGAADSRASP